MATNRTFHASVEEDFLDDVTLVDENERVDSPHNPEPMAGESNDPATTRERPVESLDMSKASSEEFQELHKSYEMMMAAEDRFAEALIREVMAQLDRHQNPGGYIAPDPREVRAVKRCHELAQKRLAAAYDTIAEATKRHASTPGGSSESNEENSSWPIDFSETSFKDFFEAIEALDMVATPGSDLCYSGINLKELHIAVAGERVRRATSRKAKPEERWLTKNNDGSYDIRDSVRRAMKDGTYLPTAESTTTTPR